MSNVQGANVSNASDLYRENVLPVVVVSTSLNDLNPRNLACVRLGQIVNELRFRMEALWVQGTNTDSFSDAELPWTRLNETLRAMYTDHEHRAACDRFVASMRCNWQDCFTAEWHHEAWLQANEIARENRQEGARVLLNGVQLSSQKIEQESISVASVAAPLVRLGILIGCLNFPSPTAYFLRDPERSVSDTNLPSNDNWRNTTVRTNHEHWLPVPPSRALNNSEVLTLNQTIESRLRELQIDMTVERFLRTVQEAEITPTGSTYLNVTLENGYVFRNGGDGIQLPHQQYRLVEHFVRRATRRTTVRWFQSNWRQFRMDDDPLADVEATTVRSAIGVARRAIRPLGLTIIQPTAGLGFVLLDLNDRCASA